MEDSNRCEQISQKIGFIGAGNMAQAIGKGLITAGIVLSSQLIASAPSDTNLKVWKEWGVKTTNSNGDVIVFADIIFLAVKPHLLDKALEDIIPTTVTSIPNKVFVSILAAVPSEVLHMKLKNALKEYWRAGHCVVRAMVNTPLMVGAGCSVFCHSKDNFHENTIMKILSSVGTCQIIPESLMNAVSGVFGCGPAFMYLIIEALSDGGVKQGVPRAMATQMAAQTMLGAAKMVLETGKHPGQLKDEVCSPGGTTITGIHALERAGVRCALIDAVEATVERAEEMAKKA